MLKSHTNNETLLAKRNFIIFIEEKKHAINNGDGLDNNILFSFFTFIPFSKLCPLLNKFSMSEQLSSLMELKTNSSLSIRLKIHNFIETITLNSKR